MCGGYFRRLCGKNGRWSYFKIIMIKKLILPHSQGHGLRAQIQAPLQNSLNPKLAFYLYKKDFYLYKKLKRFVRSRHSSRVQNGYWAQFLSDYVKKKARLLNYNKCGMVRSFFFYKTKRRFITLNKWNRRMFGFFMGRQIVENNLTRFFKSSKNVRKVDLITDLPKHIRQTNPSKYKSLEKCTPQCTLFFGAITPTNISTRLSKCSRAVNHELTPIRTRHKHVSKRNLINRPLRDKKKSNRRRLTKKINRRVINRVGGYMRSEPNWIFGWDYVDRRQLLNIKLVKRRAILGTIPESYKNLNLFSYRTYNWKVLC